MAGVSNMHDICYKIVERGALSHLLYGLVGETAFLSIESRLGLMSRCLCWNDEEESSWA